MGGLPTQRSVEAFAGDPTAHPTLWAALPDGLWRSQDRGQTWSRLAPAPARITALTVLPGKGEVVVAGTGDGRVLVSADGGTSWQGGRP